jgi:DNA-directed RNA polymerase specialized sigma24 family protein
MINWRDYEHTPTIELIGLIRMKDNPERLDKAKAAFNAFCFRFQQSITKKAEYISKNNNYDREFAIEIIERTFQKFWKYPEFKIEKMKASTPDKGVELYLLRIAQNCFYDLVNERNGINISPYDGQEEIVFEIPSHDTIFEVNNETFMILKKVLDSFSWKHKAIYLTYLQYEMKGHKMPRKLLSELREKLNLTQDTIRNYRFEVINKINEYTELWQQKEKILIRIK